MYSLREKIIYAALSVLVEMIPSMFVPNPVTRYKKGGSTGNLAFHAFTWKIVDDELVIYVDERIAPYVKYTNEPWIAPYWNGKKNPNQGWWQRFVAEFTRRLAALLGGYVEEVA